MLSCADMAYGQQRMLAGEYHDQNRVKPELFRRGYLSRDWGQALLDKQLRSLLRNRNDALIRWFGDQVVTRPDDPDWVRAADSKTCLKGNQNTPYHAIEMRSILGNSCQGIPAYYVCNELRTLDVGHFYAWLRDDCNMPSIARGYSEHRARELTGEIAPWCCCAQCLTIVQTSSNELDAARRLPRYCPNWELGGSGTPMVFTPRSWCRPIDDPFPHLRGMAGRGGAGQARHGWAGTAR
jgi:hypothetical protein